MNRFLIFFSVIFILNSCKKESAPTIRNAAKNEISTKKSTKLSDSITLDTFAFPEEIEGCSCYFSATRQEFVRQNYIYTDDFQKNAFLKINGELVKFNLTEKSQNNDGNKLNISFKNEDYTVEINGETVEKGEIETQLYKGKITIRNKTGKTLVKNFYGECGC